MKIILIAAMDPNRVIGYKNRIPWHIPEEISHFKKTTMGHTVIMGRKTYESIGAILPGRQNVVLSSNRNLTFPGCHIVHSLEEGIRYCVKQEKIFIIGGRMLYKESMAGVDTILLSTIHQKYTGDIYFPIIPADHFQLISEKEMGKEQPFTLQEYQRIKRPFTDSIANKF